VTANPTQENLDIYGKDDIAWSVPLRQLEAGEAQRFLLATSGPGGRPHLSGLGARWFDGRLYFVSGDETAKSVDGRHAWALRLTRGEVRPIPGDRARSVVPFDR
jgi:hypothetical protein